MFLCRIFMHVIQEMPKSIYRQHMECLNTSWLTTIMSTADGFHIIGHLYKFFEEHVSQSMTGLPYSLQAMDLWKESTVNLGSKLKQGWLDLFDNEKQLLSTTRNVNNVARIRATIRRNLKRKDRRKKHVECQSARTKKDEMAVQNTQACFKEFDSEPFDVSIPILSNLQSAIHASPDLLSDLRNALKGARLPSRTCSHSNLRDTISRNKRINFTNDYISKAPSDTMKQKANQMESNGLVAIFNLAEKKSLTLQQ